MTTTIRLCLHEFARGCVAVLILGLGFLFLIAVGGPKADSEEAEIQHNTARLKSLGLLPAEPIRFIEPADMPPSDVARSIAGIGVRGEEAGR
jgi:hypothetical protein